MFGFNVDNLNYKNGVLLDFLMYNVINIIMYSSLREYFTCYVWIILLQIDISLCNLIQNKCGLSGSLLHLLHDVIYLFDPILKIGMQL